MRHALLLLLIVLAPLAHVGCAGTGEGLNRWGNPVDPDGIDTADDPYFMVQMIFEARCVKCHDGPGAPKGLSLVEADSYRALVGQSSAEVPDALLVEPGYADGSYLFAKIVPEHALRAGGRMPRDGPPYLDDWSIDRIERWIAEGALLEAEEE